MLESTVKAAPLAWRASDGRGNAPSQRPVASSHTGHRFREYSAQLPPRTVFCELDWEAMALQRVKLGDRSLKRMRTVEPLQHPNV